MTASRTSASSASPALPPNVPAGSGSPKRAPLPVTIRLAEAADVPVMLDIYAHHIRHGLATFEEVVPEIADFNRRWQGVTDAGLPWLVAVGDAEGLNDAPVVLGYAYATQFRPRSAYRFTLEDSVYLRSDLGGRGVGRLLLTELLARCEAGPWRQMMAVIGDSANAASIGLHRAMGFTEAGVQRAVGFKFGRWVDTVQMQRPLGAGATSLPQR